MVTVANTGGSDHEIELPVEPHFFDDRHDIV